MSITNNTDFNSAIYQLAEENNVDAEMILAIAKQAIITAYKKVVNIPTEEELENYDVDFDPEDGLPIILASKKVVSKVEDADKEILESQAKLIDSNLKSGDNVQIDVTPESFGRIAAQAAKQRIIQGIRDGVRELMVANYKDKVGKIISGIVIRKDMNYVRVEVDKAEAVVPNDEQCPGEEYRNGNRMRFLLKALSYTEYDKRMVLSRSSEGFLRALFAMEIPEISNETVEIVGLVREAGARTKITVRSKHDKVDAIGACVGPKGTRIDTIMNEVHPEKIDIISWDDEIETYIINSLSPAKVVDIKIVKADNYAKVLVNEDMLSLAIGRDGQNVRLAARLTGYTIDITSDKKAFKAKGKLETKKVEEAKVKAKEKMNAYTKSESQAV